MSSATLQPADRKVLIIDDEAGLRDMLAFGLSDRGYQVVPAAQGEEGVEKARRENFDLVVCDIMMPGKSGVEVLREIKEIQPDTEVIMATGYATLETAVESMKQGAFDYIPKPYGLDQLCSVFDRAIERRRLKMQISRMQKLVPGEWEFLSSLPLEASASLSAILGCTAELLAQSHGDVNERQQTALRHIETSARQLMSIIREGAAARRPGRDGKHA